MYEKETLVDKLKNLGYFDDENELEVVFTLEEYFENHPKDDEYCIISVNVYPDPPKTDDFYQTMLDIRNMEEVQDVLVRIMDHDSQDWFVSDTVLILTKLSVGKVKEITKHLEPDVELGWWGLNDAVNFPPIQEGMSVISL
ncbi:MAG: hypothetical protein JW891_08420 [Candidatus Lokiarchaeota archaeon]|nr:hypothetical protein [Candidatus Lokiarchaeota archaeon]